MHKDPVELANIVSRDLKYDEQLLVFLPSVNDIHESIKLFDELYKKQAYPLYAN